MAIHCLSAGKAIAFIKSNGIHNQGMHSTLPLHTMTEFFPSNLASASSPAPPSFANVAASGNFPTLSGFFSTSACSTARSVRGSNIKGNHKGYIFKESSCSKKPTSHSGRDVSTVKNLFPLEIHIENNLSRLSSRPARIVCNPEPSSGGDAAVAPPDGAVVSPPVPSVFADGCSEESRETNIHTDFLNFLKKSENIIANSLAESIQKFFTNDSTSLTPLPDMNPISVQPISNQFSTFIFSLKNFFQLQSYSDGTY